MADSRDRLTIEEFLKKSQPGDYLIISASGTSNRPMLRITVKGLDGYVKYSDCSIKGAIKIIETYNKEMLRRSNG